MMYLKKHFEASRKVLERLKGPNVVLTGSCVLHAYGLVLGKTPEDLDVAIYQPTPEQQAVIDELKVDNIAENGDIPDDYCRVTKLDLGNGSALDIIAEQDPLPTVVGWLEYEGFKLQPVWAIIGARARYARDKDYESCEKLKDLNFNL